MATATMATAAGAAALLYYTLNKKLQTSSPSTTTTTTTIAGNDEETESLVQTSGVERVSHRLIQAPATWLETISTLSETLRFTYSETLGKWPIGDLAFGISYLLKRQVSNSVIVLYSLSYVCHFILYNLLIPIILCLFSIRDFKRLEILEYVLDLPFYPF